MTRDRLGVVSAGLGLIGFGVAFLVAQLIGWDRVWPIFPIAGGLAFFLGYAASGFRDGGLVFVGTGAVLVGVFFFGFSLGRWEWEEMSRLWPVFPLIGGVAFFALFLAERSARDIGVLGVSFAALIVGGVGLAYTHDMVAGDIIKLWPLLLILVGLATLANALIRGVRRR
jgi:hypothetical protein